MKTIVIGCDNAGVEFKKTILSILEGKGIAYEDVGVAQASDTTAYADIAACVAHKILESGNTKQGILICGTGIGMAITANKFPGIYAAVCHDIFSAERARLSNDCNVITMGARIIAPQLAAKILEEWLSLEFIPGPSSEKIQRVKEYEKQNFLTI